MDVDVAECLRRWGQGDQRAAEEIVQHLYPVIARVVRLHRSQRQTDQDLIQEILMKTFLAAPSVQGRRPAQPLGLPHRHHDLLDRLRAQKVRPEIRTADLTPEETSLFDFAEWESRTPDAGKAIQARDLVDKLLSILSPEDRSLILMMDLEGKSLEEIAGLTGWRTSKIKMRLFRARTRLRQEMQKLEKSK